MVNTLSDRIVLKTKGNKTRISLSSFWIKKVEEFKSHFHFKNLHSFDEFWFSVVALLQARSL